MSLEIAPTKTYRFDILRYDENAGTNPQFRSYELEMSGEKSVLESLLRIQDEQDPSLAFRYSCRGAICGSCAMSINGNLNLACRVLLKNLHTNRVVVEPLPHFRVIKDLVIDMDPFWRRYERVQPWLHAQIESEREAPMSEEQREKIDQYFSCILCAICCGACPVFESDGDFTGPAALAKLYRFVGDPREERPIEMLQQEDQHSGVWGCHQITRCIEACPKNVRPTDGITGVRRKLASEKFKSFSQKLKRLRRKDA